MSGTGRALYDPATGRALYDPATGRMLYDNGTPTPSHFAFSGGFLVPSRSDVSWNTINSASPWYITSDGSGGYYWTPSYAWMGSGNQNGSAYVYITQSGGVWSLRFGAYFYGDLYNYYGQSQSEVLYQRSGSAIGTYTFVSFTEVNVVSRYGPITNAVTACSIS